MRAWTMRCVIGAAFGLLLLSGSPAVTQERPGSEPQPGFDFWGTGDGNLAYHRLSGNCETLDHRHGRNAAWGWWSLPLASVVVDGPGEDEVGNPVLRLRCSDGTDCIRTGHLTNVTGQARDHAIPFESVERARAFERQIADLKAACAAA